jgi:hypothetical protein
VNEDDLRALALYAAVVLALWLALPPVLWGVGAWWRWWMPH